MKRTGLTSWLRAALQTALLLSSILVVDTVLADQRVEIVGHRFTVEVADTPVQWARGLMFRQQLDPDRGMLFVYSKEAPRAFWMKNTLIALDILYFDKNLKLINVNRNTPPCEQDPCSTYPSDRPASYVLELLGGTASRLGLKSGDVLTLVKEQ